MRSAKSLDVKNEIAVDWAKNWQRDVDDIIRQLEGALVSRDHGRLCSAVGQLKEMSRKRFMGLDTVIKHLAEDEG
jgi:hypothetical protein